LIVVDSSALIAVLLRESEQERIAEILTGSEATYISATNVLESVQVAVGKLGEIGRAKVEILIAESLMKVVEFDEPQLALAINAFMRFGRGRDHPAKLNFGDCMAYALAKSLDAPLLYKGDDFSKTDIKSAL
jgi:ribonuclease VapC